VDDVMARNRYQGPVRAVIFDWAGTTIDYGCVGPVAAFVEVFHHSGVPVTVAEAREPMGMMKKDHLRVMCRMASVSARWNEKHGRPPTEADVERMYQELEPLIVSSISAYSDIIPGTLGTMAELRGRGIKIGSTTGYTGPIMEVLNDLAAKAGYKPDATICSSDVPSGRPSPFMCYLNAIRLEVFPLEAVVKIGDTVVDIKEGLNAGMWTIGVTQTGSEIGLSEKEVAALDRETLHTRLTEVKKKFSRAGAHYVIKGVWECLPIIDLINERLARGERP
jgi:phosphonoacetaldehyde hydrolase